MDSHEPPSIFSRPEEPTDPPRSRWAPPTAEHLAVRPPDPPVTPPTSGPPAEPPSGSRQQVVLLGAMGLAIVALAGFIAASVLGGDEQGRGIARASTTASPSRTASVESSASTGPSATVVPTPTPLPTPVGPPQVISQGWARVRTLLNVRSEPSLAAAGGSQLVPGAVVAFLDGPQVADGYNWYEVESLGGRRGWIASGTVSDPFVEQIASSSELLRCGPVSAPVFSVSGASIAARDPIHIGTLALPAAAFSAEELGALELMRATGAEACFTATRPRGRTHIYADFGYYACGHPVLRDGRVELHPLSGMDVVAEYRVKDVATVHAGILDRSGVNDAMSLNLRAIFSWMALGSADAWGCLSHSIRETSEGTVGGIQLDARQCGVIESRTAQRIVLRPATSDTTVTLQLTTGSAVEPSLPTGVPVGMIAWAFDDPGQRSVSLGTYPAAPCP